jgi:hypothetical protein
VPEVGEIVVMRFVVQPVVDGRNPPHQPAIRPREEQGHFGVLEKRMSRLEPCSLHQARRRHPVRMAAVQDVGEVDELPATGAVPNRRHSDHVASFGWSRLD